MMGTRLAITNIDHTQPPLPVELLLSTIDSYLKYKEEAGQALALYQSRLTWLLRWLRIAPIHNEEMQPSDFVEFRKWLGEIRAKRLNKPLGATTQMEIMKRVRSVLRWAFVVGRLPHDYSSWIPAANYDAVDPLFTFDDDEDLAFGDGLRPVNDQSDLQIDPARQLLAISTSLVRSWLEIFLNAKRLAGLSELTLRDYHQKITYYLDFVANNSLSPDALAPVAIEFYIQSRRISVSPHTTQDTFAVLRNFCNWLVKRRYIEVSPMLDIERPKTPHKRMRAVTYSQYREIYLSIKGDDWMAKRDRLILTILFFSGLRASELVKLQVADIEQDGMIYIREGKGGRDRLVPFHPDVPFLAREYLAVRPPLESPFLFASNNGSGGIRGVMQYQGLQSMLRRRCRQANLPHYNLHSFRHGFAIAFLNADMQMSAVSAAMGHTSVNTTQIYARWNSAGLLTAYVAALAKLGAQGVPT